VIVDAFITRVGRGPHTPDAQAALERLALPRNDSSTSMEFASWGGLVNTTLAQLMHRNVLEVFGERDSERRKSVISELYTEDCIFNDFETDDQTVGRDALNARVEHLLEGAPGFVFRLAGPAQVIHDLGRVPWHFGPNEATPVVTGMDVAVFEQGRIASIYAFIDQASRD
jgi:hypothetical protein